MDVTVSFTKLFSSITTSTIWREDNATRLVWITMLAMADKHGHVIASIPGLADMARVSLDETLSAVEKLSSPDPWSSSKEHEGRRIEAIDRGWKLLNYQKFREMKDTEERREYMKDYMRRYRKPDVNNVNSGKHVLTQAEAEAEADKVKVKPSRTHFVRPSVEEVRAYIQERRCPFTAEEWIDHYQANGWKVGRNAMKDWQAAIRTWEKKRKAEMKTKLQATEGLGATEITGGFSKSAVCSKCGAIGAFVDGLSSLCFECGEF